MCAKTLLIPAVEDWAVNFPTLDTCSSFCQCMVLHVQTYSFIYTHVHVYTSYRC